MGVRLSFPKLYEFHTRTELFILHYKQRLEAIRDAITTFSGATSYSGGAADNVRSYLKETHLTIINMMLTYLDTYNMKQASYIAYIIGLDKFREADLDNYTLDQCTQDLEAFSEDFHSLVRDLKAIFNVLDDYCDIREEYSTYNGNVLEQKITDRADNYPGQVDFLKTVIEDHEVREYAGIVAPLQQYSDSLITLIGSLSNKPVAKLGNYNPGDVKKCDGYEDASEGFGDSKEYLNNLPEGDPGEAVEDAFGDYVGENDGERLDNLYNGAKSAKDFAGGVGKTLAGGSVFLINPAEGTKDVVDGVKTAVEGGKTFVETLDNGAAHADGDNHYDDNDIPDTDTNGIPTVHNDDDYEKKGDVKTKVNADVTKDVDKGVQGKVKDDVKKNIKKKTSESSKKALKKVKDKAVEEAVKAKDKVETNRTINEIADLIF